MLLFAGMISTLTLFKAAVIPYVVDLALSTVPQLWVSFRNWVMSPLCVYLVLNFIIVAIAATSTFQPSNDNNKKADNSIQSQKAHLLIPEKAVSNIATEILFADDTSPEIISIDDSGIYPARKTENWHHKEEEKMVSNIATDRLFTGDPSPETISGNHSDENPKTIQEEEEEEDSNTLESTWEAIMGPSKLKKSESWDVAPRLARAGDRDHDDQVKMDGQDDPVAWARREMRKSNTFSDRVTLIRDQSMSPEELNQRAEAFIKKVNNDIRLQRLESDQRFLDMVNRGL